jgi:hypothetical protein
MARPSSNRRLFHDDGYTFIRWISEDDKARMLSAGDIETCTDMRTNRTLGFKLKKRERVSSASALIPFGRSYNPMMEPPALHYEIPYAGDCRSTCLRRFNLRVKTTEGVTRIIHRTIRVSTRKLDLSKPVVASASVQQTA